MALFDQMRQIDGVVEQRRRAKHHVATRDATEPCGQEGIEQAIECYPEHAFKHANIDHNAVDLKIGWRLGKEGLRADAIKDKVKWLLAVPLRQVSRQWIVPAVVDELNKR